MSRPWPCKRCESFNSARVPFLYVEPGTVAIRSTNGGTIGEGKMIIDLKTGDIWGFPTTSSASPYPIDPTSKNPPLSKPVYLGKFDLSDILKAR
jgi:hypothetical protein